MFQIAINMSKEVIICVGCSGAGKSSWAAQFIKDNPNYLRINRDDIRKTLVGDLDGYYQRKDLNSIELEINDIEEYLFNTIIGLHSKSVIIDNTNLKQSYINRWLKLIQNEEDYKLDFKFKLFDIELEEAINRVIIRDLPEGKTIFDASYIDKQHSDYQQIKQWIINNYKDKII